MAIREIQYFRVRRALPVDITIHACWNDMQIVVWYSYIFYQGSVPVEIVNIFVVDRIENHHIGFLIFWNYFKKYSEPESAKGINLLVIRKWPPWLYFTILQLVRFTSFNWLNDPLRRANTLKLLNFPIMNISEKLMIYHQTIAHQLAKQIAINKPEGCIERERGSSLNVWETIPLLSWFSVS